MNKEQTMCDSETETSQKSAARRVLSLTEYEAVQDFISNHQGLAIDCEIDLIRQFPQFDELTLKSIVEITHTNRMRSHYYRYDANAQKYLNMYKQYCKQSSPKEFDSSILLDIARSEGMGPLVMCRSVLRIEYQHLTKDNVNNMTRFPHMIDDPQLAANAAQCLCSDNQNGPLVDLKRRLFGEENEFKLKQMATAAGMHYYDENDLRRLGYDKTPDIKMILPFLYKGEVINWIESKAIFSDIKTHRSYIRQQLNSYCNRFGPGIVIYWLGYLEDIATLPDNSIGVTVLDDFPAKDDIQVMDLSDACSSYDDDSSQYDDKEVQIVTQKQT